MTPRFLSLSSSLLPHKRRADILQTNQPTSSLADVPTSQLTIEARIESSENDCVAKKNEVNTGGKLAMKISYFEMDFWSEARGL